MDLKLKFTDKENTTYELILEESSFSTGYGRLKNMLTGEERTIELNMLTQLMNAKIDARFLESACGIH